MPGANLTRIEAEERKSIIAAPIHYTVKLDLTRGAKDFGSETTITFDAKPGESSFLDLIANEVSEITLNGETLDPAEAYVDSRIELARVSQIAGELGVEQPIYLRITPGVEADTHEYIRTGCEDSKFGFTMREDFAFKCVGDVLAAENVRLVGLHCHIGSQIFALHSFREAAAVMVEFMARIRDTYGHEITELDLGGGLGIAYLAEHQPSSIDDFAEVTCSAVRDLCESHNLPLPRLLVEPGRSLVAPAGVTLYTVGILKTLPGIRKYVAIDGGMSDNIRTALYHADYEPTIANKAGQPREEIVTLCGKHCESGDAVVIDMPLQKADLGDIVCVFGTGAYNMTMASNYNGQPRPAVVFVRDGASRVVTRRETYEDLYQRDL